MSRHRPRHKKRLVELRLSPAVSGPERTAPADVAPATRIQAITYGQERSQELDIAQPEELRDLIGKYPVLWVRVTGVGDASVIHKIGDIFLLHELALEDVMNVHQRSKVEPYGDHLFVVLQAVALEHGSVSSQQLSLFLGKGFVVSFEERLERLGCLAIVLERIAKDAGHVRTQQADYLLYTIVDHAVDGFFPVAEALGDALETLEDEIIEQSSRFTPARIHELKRDVVNLRRAIWPMRDAINVLTRDDAGDLLSSRTRLYMRDCYDHAIRIMDLVETQREMCSDLMDLYLSSISNKMNEIIKVLTIVTLLFMPPTLVAGIYGMNFRIPEYKWTYGYGFALGLMLITSGVVWLWAHRHGWLNDDTALK